MKKKIQTTQTKFSVIINWGLGVLFFLTIIDLSGQPYDGLNSLEGCKTKTYYSNDAAQSAKIMAERSDKVMAFYNKHIAFTPEVILLVLSQEDWSKYTRFPVYGMPHYNNNKLIVASENNDFWKSFIPPVEQLPKDLAQQIAETYKDQDGNLTMKPFFDLLAIHELGHAYHMQGGLTMQRLWMEERS